ncbi:hypothetical protein FQN54_006191 [Arachnomyces sp. PD_36]|nr:hypothetical protein FQN54_006191 [Arachnomyces sp. PD_36]
MNPSLLKTEATTNPLPKRPYHASCHCRRIRLTIHLPPLESLTINTCNCSICTKNGYLVAYPLEGDVVVESCGEGEGNEEMGMGNGMGEYRFGERRKPHWFCRECGTSMMVGFGESGFVEERGLVAVNIRTFDGIEDVLDKLTYRKVDGKHNLNPPYKTGS